MQKSLTIAVIREGKTPPDFRVALTPAQCVLLQEKHPEIQIIVQSSPIRRFKDEEYAELGITVQEDISSADVMIGVKEVPIDQLIPNKSYLFFSHTFKKQPYNAKLLKAILEKNITLIDYEVLKDETGKRVIGFGRYAGIVGVFEGVRALGYKKNWFELPSPMSCHDRKEMETYGSSISFPQPIKAVVTGWGRVGHGAEEMIRFFGMKRISPEEFLQYNGNESVYVHLDTADYYERISDGGFDKKDFYSNPQAYSSCLNRYVSEADIYFACHLWKSGNPVLLSQDDLNAPGHQCQVIADVSCDINGPIAATIKASTIQDPFFGYNKETGEECDWRHPSAIMMMTIDNLPCELPRDASEDFGNELLQSVIPNLLMDNHPMIEGATETKNGELTPPFQYLSDYAKG
jgi:saccharopine dehydrogenase (NAD+, L-lysine-forming)